MSSFTFTSESVTEGHPDKMADQISDAVLDAILAEDPMARVACETLVTTGLVVVALGALAYAFLGPWLPGVLAHRGYGVRRLVEHLYLSTEGIWGIPLGVSADFVFLFVLFGAVLEVAGGGALLIALAERVAGRSRGGPAKTAAVASAFMGSLSGSAVANVVTTGTFTIPLMQRAGFKPFFAAGIEAAASTGGQLMPPIMGAGAFILATWTNIPYAQVAAAAVIPALLYYVALLATIHFRACFMDIAPGREIDTEVGRELAGHGSGRSAVGRRGRAGGRSGGPVASGAGRRGGRPGTGGSGAHRDHADRVGDREGLPLLHEDAVQHALDRAGHGRVNLVGADLGQVLVHGDRIAGLLQPFDERAFDDRLHLGESNGNQLHLAVAIGGTISARVRGGRRWGGGGRVPAGVDSRKQRADLDGVTRVRQEFSDHAPHGSGDLDVHLVGGEVQQHVTRFDRVTLRDSPFDDGSLGDRLPELREDDLVGG